MSPRPSESRAGGDAASAAIENAVRAPLAPPPPPAGRLDGVDDMLVSTTVGVETGAAQDASGAASGADTEAASLLLRQAGPHLFFGGAADPVAHLLLCERLPQHRDRIVAVAERLAGGVPLDRRQQERIAADDPAIVWEPRRQQWPVRIAQAYALSGERRFAEAAAAAVTTWLDEHPAGVAADVTTVADSASRAMSWCWTLMLLSEAPAVPAGWRARVVAAVREHAVDVHRSLSQYCPPPTQATGTALALFYAGTLFPGLAESAQWRETGMRLLLAQSDVQISADGVHFEQSTCFHAYTVDVYLHFVLLARRHGIAVPPVVVRRLERMLDFLLAIRRPDGSVPAIGDGDGGALLPLDARATFDSRGRFAVGAVLFDRPDFAWAAGSLAADVVWLMGADGARAFDALRPAPPAQGGSRIFPSGGYAVMRTGWEGDAHQMIVDVGALGCPVGSGHGHADLLGLQCAVFGEPAIVDPGAHCYRGDSRWRDYFRSTAAHSTVVVDGASQAEASGPFGWRRHPRVRLREWHSTADFDFVDAEHDGYASLPDPVTHRRRVIFVKPGFWIVVDDLSGKARHQIDLTFQLARGDVRLESHPWARAAMASGAVLWISPFPSAPAQPAVKCGEPSPIRGWISPEIARLSPAPMLIYSFAVALPWRIVTLLLPDRQGLATPPAVRPLYDAGGLPHGFVFERPRRVVRFDDRAVLVERE